MSNPSSILSEENTDQSAGAVIKTARLNSGITIEQLSGILKVAPKKIQALEENRWTDLGDSVFIRALASSVAKHLKIDHISLLNKLPAAAHTPKFDEELLAGPSSKGISFEETSKKKYLYLIFLFLILALAMFFIPDRYLSKEKWSQVTSSTPNNAPENTIKPSTETVPAVVSEQAAALPSNDSSTKTEAVIQPLENPPASVQASSATTAATTTNTKPELPPPSTEKTEKNPPLVSGDTVIISATEASWIEVRDAQGQLKIQKLLNKGETVGLSGGLPYSVVIGRSDLVSVQFQGKPFDMTPYAKNNVAKFQLK
jgi:cytoskeleton protein RodZ